MPKTRSSVHHLCPPDPVHTHQAEVKGCLLTSLWVPSMPMLKSQLVAPRNWPGPHLHVPAQPGPFPLVPQHKGLSAKILLEFRPQNSEVVMPTTDILMCCAIISPHTIRAPFLMTSLVITNPTSSSQP